MIFNGVPAKTVRMDKLEGPSEVSCVVCKHWMMFWGDYETEDDRPASLWCCAICIRAVFVTWNKSECAVCDLPPTSSRVGRECMLGPFCDRCWPEHNALCPTCNVEH